MFYINIQELDSAGSSMSGGLGRLPEEEGDLWSVPNNAAGDGYAPMGPSDRWLDGQPLKVGDCVLYRGEACREYLTGRHIMIVSDSREDMYDVGKYVESLLYYCWNSDKLCLRKRFTF